MQLNRLFAYLRLLCLAALLAGALPAHAQSTCQARAFNGHEEQVSAAYIAYYGRPADTGGLAYWAGKLAAEGGRLDAIIDAFGNSSEYRQRFGGLSNRELIRNLYQQLYGRDPDAAGWAFYEMWLDTKVLSLASIAISIMDGTEGDDVAILNNRKSVARHFITRMESLGAAAPQITDGDLLANLMAAIDASAASRENACAQVNALIDAQASAIPSLTMAAHEAGASGAITNLSGAVGSERHFKVTVPAGVTDLVIRTARTAGGMGDVDLYVSRGVQPIPGNADCSSTAWFSADEQCSFAAPVAGEYFILLRGYFSDYSGITLSASWRGSTRPPEVEVLTGHLYDSAVQGVQYRACSGANMADCIEGMTGLRGEFNYRKGQLVEFKIGGLRIGVAQGQELVTPDKLAGGNQSLALQIAQLLQSLDEDRDTSNGIVIPESVRSLAVGEYPNGQDVRFVNNSQVLGKLAPGRALVSMEQVSAHAQGASLLDVMLANGSPVIPQAILGTKIYPTTGKINYESLNRNVHARLRLALFRRKMMEEQGIIPALLGHSETIKEIESSTTAWINKIESAKAQGDLVVAYISLVEKKDGARALEALVALVASVNAHVKVIDPSSAIKDEYIEAAKTIVLKTSAVVDSDPKTLALSFIETLKAVSSASGIHPAFKRALEGAAAVVECSRPKDPTSIWQCTTAAAEIAAKGLVEAIGTGQLLLTESNAIIFGKAYDFMLAYYESASNPVYMREKYGMDFFGSIYDVENMLGLDLHFIYTAPPNETDLHRAFRAQQANKVNLYRTIISRWMAEIENEAALYANAFNLKYAGLLDLKATGIENGGKVPVGTAVDFEATFKNMTAGNYTVRSINWVATGVGSPTVVAAGTRANVRFNSAGTYRVAAHAEVLLPDGQTYFMVDTFTVVVNDATPVPTLTLAATPGNGYVDLSWNAIPGATSYAVHMTAGTVGPEGPPLYATTSATHYRVSGLQNGTLYRFTVQAFKDGQVAAGSDLVSATPQGPVVPPDGDLIAGRYLPIEGGSVIRDTVNNLEWQRCSVGQTWDGAAQRCDGTAAKYNWSQATQLTAAGGFRIPTISELKTLVYCSSGNPKQFGPLDGRNYCYDRYSRPTIFEVAFPNTPDWFFWSGSPYDSHTAGYVNFYYGEATYYGTSSRFHVRFVRGGQSSQSSASLSARLVTLVPVNAASTLAPALPVAPALANLKGYEGTPLNAALNSIRPDASGHGAYFLSRATNLVPGVNNGAHHLFHFDAATGQLRNLGAAASGEPGNGDITAFDVAPQAGRLVFRTRATNLGSGPGLYLVDLETGTRQPLLTAAQRGGSDPGAENPVLGTSARALAFDAPDAQGQRQVFTAGLDASGLYDLRQETPLDAAVATACCVALSADGRYLAWQETGHDGRMQARVLELATDATATLDWPQGEAAQALHLSLSADGAQLHWLAAPVAAEDAAPLHGADNPLFVPATPLQ